MKISLNCSVCNVEFQRDEKLIKSLIRTGKYLCVCSKKCMGVKFKKPLIIKTCPTCNKEFETSTAAHGKVCCSKECSKKYSYSFVDTRINNSHCGEWINKLKSEDPEGWKEYRRKLSKIAVENSNKKKKVSILERNFSEIGWELKRKYVIEEQNGKCSKCGIDSWLGSPLTLEVDHINGNNQDDTRSNLTAMCPNCHSQTPTHRANNKRMAKKVTDEDLINAIKSEPSIRQALIKVGLTPKGGNYVRAKKIESQLKENETVISLTL